MKISRYEIEGPEQCTMAVVADLHEHAPEKVLEILRKEKPDLIFCPGDILERKKYGPNPKKKESKIHQLFYFSSHLLFDFILLIERLFKIRTDVPSKENGENFFQEASKIAPVYYSLGNHEWYLTKEDQKLLEDCHVTVLDNADIQWNQIRIGGLSSIVEETWLDSFGKKEGYKILLNHHPEYTKQYDLNQKADLILSGHAHGGLFKIGNIGIFAPGQGFFPEYTSGQYGKMIVSAGCSNTTPVPRIGNPCEVIMIKMKKSS